MYQRRLQSSRSVHYSFLSNKDIGRMIQAPSLATAIEIKSAVTNNDADDENDDIEEEGVIDTNGAGGTIIFEDPYIAADLCMSPNPLLPLFSYR